MEQPTNLKQYKSELRLRIKERRRAMSPQKKERSDKRIADKLRSLYSYRRAKTLLIYVSTEIEVDTINIINRAFAEGKRVAVPRCVPGTREMEFYLIESLDELSGGTYGVPEPEPDPEKLLTDFEQSVCVIPALACDKNGYRLGYGGGYYDRFLRDYSGEKLLILYKSCLLPHIWHGRFDVKVDRIITEYFIATVR